jgi:demethoxyubiquinone hydroxylase (CLK1/Coq7/Cat5 family)
MRTIKGILGKTKEVQTTYEGIVNKMAVTRAVIFQISHLPSALSCRCLCTSARKGLHRADALVDKILRVDHAGEVGANRIYEGQMAVLGSSKSAPVIKVYDCFCISL